MERKRAVQQAFGRAASSYGNFALLQQEVALELCRRFAPFPEGPWLEIGCGTGFLTKELLKHSPSKLYANDLSQEMLDTLPSDHRLFPLQGDGEKIELPDVSMVISSFSLQWFECPEQALSRFARVGKKVIAALPLAPSFQEWHEVVRDAGVPMTLNRLPSEQELTGELQTNFSTCYYPITFATKWDFLSWFKGIGAQIALNKERLPPSFLKKIALCKKPFQTGITVGFLEI